MLVIESAVCQFDLVACRLHVLRNFIDQCEEHAVSDIILFRVVISDTDAVFTAVCDRSRAVVRREMIGKFHFLENQCFRIPADINDARCIAEAVTRHNRNAHLGAGFRLCGNTHDTQTHLRSCINIGDHQTQQRDCEQDRKYPFHFSSVLSSCSGVFSCSCSFGIRIRYLSYPPQPATARERIIASMRLTLPSRFRSAASL